jgi:hypothetical protein
MGASSRCESWFVHKQFGQWIKLAPSAGSDNSNFSSCREHNCEIQSFVSSALQPRPGYLIISATVTFLRNAKRGALYYVLSNHFYIGEVKYKNEILPGEQPQIMDRTL